MKRGEQNNGRGKKAQEDLGGCVKRRGIGLLRTGHVFVALHCDLH